MELIGPGSVLSPMMGDPLGAAGGGQVRRGRSGKNGPWGAGVGQHRGLAMLTFSSSGKCVSPGDLPTSGTAVRNRKSCLAL